MATLKAITVSRYRSFKEPTRFDITPLVIMIGKNGSGKSIITRLLIVLSDSLHNGQFNQPISLIAGGVRHASEFSDIPNMKSSLAFEIGAEIEADGDIISLNATIRYVAEKEFLALEALVIDKRNGQRLEVTLADGAQFIDPLRQYQGRESGSDDWHPVTGFYGICPILSKTPLEEWLAIIDCFKNAMPVASYLGPFRTELGSLLGSPRPNLTSIGSKGENVLEIMADDWTRQDGITTKKISEWFEKELKHTVIIDRYADYSRIILNPIGKKLSITLSETGAGFSQVLPVVAQNIISQRIFDHGHCLIAEQPELHLHPAIHGAIADLYISTMISASGFIILETHSEQLIMRVRRRIAEGLDPRLVSIWSVGHGGEETESGSIAHISFDNDGNPSDWPEGVFEESFAELALLRSAARTRET